MTKSWPGSAPTWRTRTTQSIHRDNPSVAATRLMREARALRWRGRQRRMTGGLARSLAGPYYPSVALTLKDMSTWTELIGHAQLRSFVDDDGHFWLEQNATKKTKWAKLARDGHDVAGVPSGTAQGVADGKGFGDLTCIFPPPISRLSRLSSVLCPDFAVICTHRPYGS